MQPAQLTAASFAGYPAEARETAIRQLALLRDLPLPLLPILLRELIAYDWKLPAERHALQRQLNFLAALAPGRRESAMSGFRALPVKAELAATDWVNDPSGFLEKLTAWLWSTSRMEQFRSLAESYAAQVNEAQAEPHPLQPRLGVVVLGADLKRASLPLFRKLRPSGVHLTGVVPEGGMAALLHEVVRRAQPPATSKTAASGDDQAFRHWYLDGGAAAPLANVTQVSYAHLEQPRAKLLEHIQGAINAGDMGPEALRTLLAHMRPEDVGLRGEGPEAVLNHFKLSLLTEGSGTQIFATTFVQWAARECVRRAQPETLLVRYAPRRQATTMNAMLSGVEATASDPEGSMIDADMGAYYTWLNMRRLTGSEDLRFLVWQEGHSEALAIGPGLPRGTSSDSKLPMEKVLALLA